MRQGRPAAPGGACPIDTPATESDPLKQFMKWYSYDRLHISLDTVIEETPAQASEHKMPPPGADIDDE